MDLNYTSGGVGSVGSPSNMAAINQAKNPKSLIMTDSTHANSQSDAANGFNSLAQKRLRSQQNYINNMNTQTALNALAAGSVGSNNLDDQQRRDLLLKNTKSLGNSLGTAHKKSLNMSQPGMVGIERDQSTLNDGQFFTLAKTGLLNNLNLSQLIKSQGILDEDGIEDLHFYFVAFSNHKSKLLALQEKKL